MSTRFVAGTFLVVALTFLSILGWGLHQRHLKEVAEAALVEKGVELAGAKKAALATQKEVVKFVEVPAAVAAAVKHGTMVAVASAHVEATSNTITVPCPPTPVPDAADTAPHAAETAPSVNLTFGLTGEFFIGKIKNGAVESTSSFKASVWSDQGWHSDVPIEAENVKFDVRFSKDVARAIDEASKPWLRRHLRPYVGVGLTYDPFAARLSPGVQVGYGLIF